jgi:hypothetical protein
LRQILAGDHDIAKAIHQRDRREILERIVSKLRVQRRIERHVREPADHERVTIGLALGRGLRADDRSGAGFVLDEKRLSRSLRQRVGKVPPDEVVAAARADRDNDLHGAVGIAGLRARRRHADHRCPNRRCQAPKSLHRRSPCGATMRHARGHGNAGMEIGQ